MAAAASSLNQQAHGLVEAVAVFQMDEQHSRAMQAAAAQHRPAPSRQQHRHGLQRWRHRCARPWPARVRPPAHPSSAPLRRPPAHRPQGHGCAPRRQLKTIAIGSRSDEARLSQGLSVRLAPPRWAGGQNLKPREFSARRPTSPPSGCSCRSRIPRRAAAVAHVAGEGDGAARAVFLAVAALHQFGVARRLAPVALDALAGARTATWVGVHVGGPGLWSFEVS